MAPLFEQSTMLMQRVTLAFLRHLCAFESVPGQQAIRSEVRAPSAGLAARLITQMHRSRCMSNRLRLSTTSRQKGISIPADPTLRTVSRQMVAFHRLGLQPPSIFPGRMYPIFPCAKWLSTKSTIISRPKFKISWISFRPSLDRPSSWELVLAPQRQILGTSFFSRFSLSLSFCYWWWSLFRRGCASSLGTSFDMNFISVNSSQFPEFAQVPLFYEYLNSTPTGS